MYKEERPWGKFEILLDEKYTKVKQITVKAKHRLSYQYHEHRSEYWTAVQGDVTIILDGKEILLKQGQNVFVPKGAKHRIWNKQETEIKIIEVQVGDYFGEDDIIRLEDDYNRN